MTTTRLQLFLYLFAFLCLQGCATIQPKLAPAVQTKVDSHAKLIEVQQNVLKSQSEKLDNLSATQLAMADTLLAMSQQLGTLQSIGGKSLKTTPGKTINTNKATRADNWQDLESGKILVGRNEWVWLDRIGRAMKARIDTGSLSSSLSATEIQRFERNGEKWVRFKVPDDSEQKTYESPLVRHVRIRNASSEVLERRPVVRLTVRLGDIVEDTVFTLSNRENMLYPVLLGREFLRDIAIVDVAKKFTQPKLDAQTVSR